MVYYGYYEVGINKGGGFLFQSLNSYGEKVGIIRGPVNDRGGLLGQVLPGLSPM